MLGAPACGERPGRPGSDRSIAIGNRQLRVEVQTELGCANGGAHERLVHRLGLETIVALRDAASRIWCGRREQGREIEALWSRHLAQEIQKRRYDRGILICGTGLGMAMIANKVEGVFAGTCHDVYSAERLKKSNDAQVLTLGARVIGPELAKMVVDAWLDSEFQGGGSLPKVDRMRELEKESFHGKD